MYVITFPSSTTITSLGGSHQRQPQPQSLSRRPQVQAGGRGAPRGPDDHCRARRDRHLDPSRRRVRVPRVRRDLGLPLEPTGVRPREVAAQRRMLPAAGRRNRNTHITSLITRDPSYHNLSYLYVPTLPFIIPNCCCCCCCCCLCLLLWLLLQVVDAVLQECLSVDPKLTAGIGGDNMTCMVVLLDETLPR